MCPTRVAGQGSHQLCPPHSEGDARELHIGSSLGLVSSTLNTHKLLKGCVDLPRENILIPTVLDSQLVLTKQKFAHTLSSQTGEGVCGATSI